jgi:hypothetical protein
MNSPKKDSEKRHRPRAEECVHCLTKGSTKKGQGLATLSLCANCGALEGSLDGGAQTASPVRSGGLRNRNQHYQPNKKVAV